MRLMEQVQRMFTDRKAAAATSYGELVRSIAAGKPLPDNAVDQCISFGRSVSDLEHDVETLSRRLEADQQLRRAKQLATDHAGASAEATARHLAMEELAARHKAEMDAAQAAYSEAYQESRSLERQRGMMVERATRTLVSTADPAIGQRIQSLESERSRLQTDSNASGRMTAQAEQLPEPQREQRRREIAEMLKANGERIAAIGEEIQQLEAARLKPENCCLD